MSLLKIAHIPPAVIDVDATVLEAVQVMAEEGVGAVAVIEKAEKEELRGVFTERDVMLRVVLKNRAPNATRVGDVMSSPAETIPEQVKADEALNHMLQRHIRHLPIVAPDGMLLGMLSIRNLLEHMVEDLQRQVEGLDQYLSNDGPGG
jgi:CBS domain-containing protein